MFIVRCIEKGIDVKLTSKWQEHSDGGKLILRTTATSTNRTSNGWLSY